MTRTKTKRPPPLSHVRDSDPGIRRERFRKAFRYRTASGGLVRDRSILDRIRMLAIPPAWEDVWICASERGHIQATGRDARGRKQYRYHANWTARRGHEKYGRLDAFGRVLPAIRRRVKVDLAKRGLTRETVLAAVVSLLDRTHLRIGNDEYVKANNSFGLCTLLDRHASFTGQSVCVRFRGKSGVEHERKVNDRRLATIVRRCRDLPGQDLFQYRDERGRVRTIGSGDVNEYLRVAAGDDFTAKSFRTWAGTVQAAKFLSNQPAPESPTAGKQTLQAMFAFVSKELGNTPTVCRKSYVHPCVIDAFLSGNVTKSATVRGLTAAESLTLGLVQTSR